MNWFKLLWGSLFLPRCSFISWLAIYNRLATKDRHLQWGKVVNPACVFYKQSDESRNHILVTCPVSKAVWLYILSMSGVSRTVLDWDGNLFGQGCFC